MNKNQYERFPQESIKSESDLLDERLNALLESTLRNDELRTLPDRAIFLNNRRVHPVGHIIDFSVLTSCHALDGREFSTLTQTELNLLTALRNEESTDGFLVRIEPVDDTPEIQIELCGAYSWESQIEICRRVRSVVRISKVTHLGALSGAGKYSF